MKKVLSFVGDVFYYAILALLFASIAMSLIGIKPYFVPTGSMEPNLHAKSLVFVNERFDYSEVKLNDIIVFERESDNLLIIHRVVEIADEGIYTKGDANSIGDGICITPDLFIGKCIYIIPELGGLMEPLYNFRTWILNFFSNFQKTF